MTNHAAQVYAALLERVGEAHPRPRLEPVRRLAELAGAPQTTFSVIQVAGTNGKTSTSRAIESILRAYGLRTGLFTSPHLEQFTERIRIDGDPITGDALAAAWQELALPLEILDAELEADGQSRVTFFEALMVLAFLAFADAPVEVAVIEVGMGGEWDASNIADATVAVFTPIALDHVGILGDTIAEIARTKAGILKPGMGEAGAIAVSAEQDPEALAELLARAEETGVALHVLGRDFQLSGDRLAVGGRQVDIIGPSGAHYDPAFVPLHGSHQSANTAVAIAAVEAFFGGTRPVPEAVLDEGLARLTVPGRLQLIGTEPIVYVDAAHNPHGAHALAEAVRESFSFSELAVIVGILGEKDAAGVLTELAPIASRMILTRPDSPRALEVGDLLDIADAELGDLSVTQTDSLAEALTEARDWALEDAGRAVLVTGSVVLAGEALSLARAGEWGVSL